QSFPSGPAAMAVGVEWGVGIANSKKWWVIGSNIPILPPVSVSQILPSGPAAMALGRASGSAYSSMWWVVGSMVPIWSAAVNQRWLSDLLVIALGPARGVGRGNSAMVDSSRRDFITSTV